MREEYYVKLMGEHDWYVFKKSTVPRAADQWIAKCHSKADAHLICDKLNG